MARHNIPKNDEEALQALLDDVERTVREEYWNDTWRSTGVTLKFNTAVYRGD